MRRPLVALLLASCAVGCGRFGFEELPPPSGLDTNVAPSDEDDRQDAGANATDGARGSAPPSTPEPNDAEVATNCSSSPLAFAQWFAFEGTGQEIADDMGGPAGSAVSAVLDGKGSIELTGGAYIDLPASELRADTSSTALYWLIWRGDAEQPIFHVQKPLVSLNITALPASVTLFASPEGLTLRYEVVDGSQEIVSTTPLTPGRLTHLAVRYDSTKRESSLYVDGQLVASDVLGTSITNVIYGERVWLGYDGYASFEGRFVDLRALPQALSPCQIRGAYLAGPDARELCDDCPTP